MSPAATELRLALATRADNLALVRQALAGLADALEIEDEPLADLKQIATEGCMNAIVHAYPADEEGPMEVSARASDGAVELRVRDWGDGFKPRPAEDDDVSLRLGLPLIATLADSFQIASADGGGTILTATVLMKRNGSTPAAAISPPEVPSEAEVNVTAGRSARPVIARVIAVAATRAGFSLDRMSDGVLLGDAISSHEPADFSDGRVGVELEECGPNLCVRVGPFVEGGAERMVARMELPALGASLSKLASRIEIERGEDGEFLVIEIEP